MVKTANKEKPKIVFLFSDTGGGHRSAAEAIIEALDIEFPGKYEYKMVDFLQRIFTAAAQPGRACLSAHVADGIHVGIHL